MAIQKHRPCSVSIVVDFKSHFLDDFSNVSPLPFNQVSMNSCVWVHKIVGVINCQMVEPFFIRAVTCFPAITNNCASWQDPFLDCLQKCFSVSILHCLKKQFLSVHLNATKNPLTFNFSTYVIFVFVFNLSSSYYLCIYLFTLCGLPIGVAFS